MKARRILIVGCLVCLGPSAGAAPGNRDPKPEVLARAMDGPLGEVEAIVFATRAAYNDSHWYANIGYYCDDAAQKAYAGNDEPGRGKLQRLHVRTGRVTTLLDAGDGSIRDLKVHHDGTRILYTRWGYVDRSQVEFHHLWTMNPDGSNQTVYFGNMHAGGLYIDAKPIPGTESVVASWSPGHGRNDHRGRAAVVHQKQGPDARGELRILNQHVSIRDPFALSADWFLMARENQLLVMDSAGAYAVVAQAISTHRATGIIGKPAVGHGQASRSAREDTRRDI